MIPKPPFLSDLTPEKEISEFEALKPRLMDVWDQISLRNDEPHTSVVVPSLTLDQMELKKLEGASFYEERLLFLLIRLRNPRARVVFVTSQPVHALILEYYFQLLVGIPASHARSRLTMLCAYDASPRSLTEKVLERPRLVERIRAAIPDKTRAYLTVFNSTPLERKLAVLLGIPLNGVDPALNHLGTKSGSRRAFREAGVELPAGFEDLKTEDEVTDAIIELKKLRPGLRRAVVKLNDSFSGEGNGLFRYTGDLSKGAVHDGLSNLELAVATETREEYFDKFHRMGGIVEEFLEGEVKHSPSVQLRVDPHGAVLPISTHDQVLGGPSGQVFLGCLFPAADEYRLKISGAGMKIGAVLAQKGVVSRFGIDFLVTKSAETGETKVYALEINLRMGGTTHPFLALQFITGGKLDPETGLFYSPRNHTKFYRATDNLISPAYRGLAPEDLVEILTFNGLHYNYNTESGVLFHLIGAVSEFGKLGMSAIGNTREEVEALYAKTLDILDRETTHGR
ncbi:MAG TPA: peptide ligase PGM1-related protein [Thermoanaerobaculia bacterium]|nr:peptide ligase PGM1-related protein [Thermoanaerobaculia bacterium]